MADEEIPRIPEKIEFKKPVFIGRVGKLPKKADIATNETNQASRLSSSVSSSEESAVEHKIGIPPSQVKVLSPFPYKEPKWSGLCPDGSGYTLEVLKSGMIIERIDLTTQAFYVFGRLANSHIVLYHPTISRHHAVLQYKAFVEEGEPPSGWYLYDLSSTHGTFHNGVRLKKEHFSRVRVGHQIKFGASSRSFIMMGPDYDCEGESDLTVTEIKQKALQMKLERERMLQEAKEQKEKDRLDVEKKREEQGIDWGMGEDAEEEPDLTDNPYAVAANEELYLDDPKKTLRGYFEREGHELSYDCEERGVGQFICRVELPIDDARGKSVVAEVIHRGKKKEAVVACALEACRILDRAGLLRQAKHESRRRKQRDWSADDYYDSDEDTFLDRTGSVEHKRHSRMRRHGALPPEDLQPNTYDSLRKKIKKIEENIAAKQKGLENLRVVKQVADEKSGEDALDEYMNFLGRQGQTMAQKAAISNAKLSIQKLKIKLFETRRLAELARPADAPPLVKKSDKKLVKLSNSVVYGKRIKLKEDINKKLKPTSQIKVEETEFVEEMDSDEEKTTEDNNVTDNSSNTKTLKETAVEIDATPKMEIHDIETADNSSNSLRHDDIKSERNAENAMEVREEKKDSTRVRVKTDEKVENDERIGKTKSEPGTSTNNISSADHYNDSSEDTEHVTEVKRVFGPMRPPDNYVIPENYFDQETDRDLPEIEEADTI